MRDRSVTHMVHMDRIARSYLLCSLRRDCELDTKRINTAVCVCRGQAVNAFYRYSAPGVIDGLAIHI